MRYIKLMTIAAFSMIVLLPLAGFRFGEGIVSEIDNRKLQENPFRPEERAKKQSLRRMIVDYVSDRIGFRDDMISAYTMLNDKLFGEMVHPSYCYGKEGYVFFRRMTTPTYGQYHESFVDMIKQAQDYCESRNVPFLFVFEPSKTQILSQYLPSGAHYDGHWVEEFLHALDERGIHYVDNTRTLKNKMVEGETVFNQKFDAGHWNDIGLLHGTNAILERLHNSFPGIHANDKIEFEINEILKESLPVSKFPINEYVPDVVVPLGSVENVTDQYSGELERHKQYRGFGYFRNMTRIEETPRVLFFQGSYLNKAGSKFLKYALGEYIFVHDYQNILELPYYFNIFQPECVVFEVAEYTINNNYFDAKKMEQLRFPPPLINVMKNRDITTKKQLPQEAISVKEGTALTKIVWKDAPKDIEYAWCVLEDEYDMRPSTEGGYEVTVKNEVWQTNKNEMQIITMGNGNLRIYKQ